MLQEVKIFFNKSPHYFIKFLRNSCRIILSVMLLLVLAASAIMNVNCMFGSGVDTPNITGDGQAGAIAIYEVAKGNDAVDLYAQKIAVEGKLIWSNKGVLIDSGYVVEGNMFNLHVIADGLGGAIIAWGKYISKSGAQTLGDSDLYSRSLIHINDQGVISWRRKITGLGQMISDGAGGVIVSWIDSHTEKLYIVGVNSQGVSIWGDNPLLIGACPNGNNNFYNLSRDESGSIFVVWQDQRTIYSKKILPDAEILWGEHGIAVVTTEIVSEPKIVADESGGAIVSWLFAQSDIHPGSSAPPLIFTQKIGKDGSLMWQPGGIQVSDESSSDGHLIADKNGGAILIWVNRMAIYGQKIDENGKPVWIRGPIPVWEAGRIPQSPFLQTVADGSGGVIVGWSYVEAGKLSTWGNTRRVQRLDSSGNKLWDKNGVLLSAITNQPGEGITIAQDGIGGILASWAFGSSAFHWRASYIQKVNTAGETAWQKQGVRLNH